MSNSFNGYLAVALIVAAMLFFIIHATDALSIVNVFSDPRLAYRPLKRDEDLADDGSSGATFKSRSKHNTL